MSMQLFQHADPFGSIFDGMLGRLDALERAFFPSIPARALPGPGSTTPEASNGALSATKRPSSQMVLHAPFDIIEKPEHYELLADAPGMKPEDIHVELRDDNMLTISGKTQSKHEESKDGKVWRSERTFRSFSRQFQLPENAKPEEVSANLKDGVLKVTVPKLPPPPEAPKKEPKRIPVSM